MPANHVLCFNKNRIFGEDLVQVKCISISATWDDVRSKAVVLLLLLKLFIVCPIICGGSVFGHCFVMQFT